MTIVKADRKDLAEILQLQYLAYQSEAKLLNNYSIQPLTETMDDLKREYDEGIILKAIGENGHIVGSVRGKLTDRVLHIGKLMVHPDYQRRGIGTELLRAIETLYSDCRKELFTSDRSASNLRLYEKNGYAVFEVKAITDTLHMVYLYKVTSKNSLVQLESN